MAQIWQGPSHKGFSAHKNGGEMGQQMQWGAKQALRKM
jgi:hypothetical protein